TAGDQTCSTCAGGFYLASSTSCSTCAAACGPGTWESTACNDGDHNRVCTPCGSISNCASETCTNGTNQTCSACGGGFYLSSSTSCSTCAAACGPGTWESTACDGVNNRVCSPCGSISNCASETCTNGSDQT